MVARRLDAAAARMRDGQRRTWEHAALAAVCAALAIPAIVLSNRLGIALAAGGLVELLVTVRAVAVRRALISRLALDRDAYSLPEVARYGERLAAPRQRKILAEGIRSMIRDALHPSSLYLGDRVMKYARELEGLARDLLSPSVRVHPVSVARCRRLLTEAAESPLYNPRLPQEDLAFVLHRIRAGMERVGEQ